MKRNSGKPFAIILGVILVLMASVVAGGCSSDNSQKELTGQNNNDNAATSDKVEDSETLYKQFLDGEISATRILEDGSEYTFLYSDLPHDEDDWESYFVSDEKADLDDDGEDELILTGPYGGMYLDARDGSVYVLAEGEGTTGYLSHVEYEGKTYIVHSDTSHGGRQIYIFDRFEKGQSVENFALSAEYWENENDQYDENSDFTFKDQKITMEEYETLVKEIFG